MTERTQIFSLGVTVREDRWRYTEWLQWDPHTLLTLFDAKTIGIELYSHADDPELSFDGPWEQVNQAGQSEFAIVQARLAKLLRERYNGSRIDTRMTQ